MENVLGYLGPKPASSIAAFDPTTDLRRLRGFYHRFNTSRDLGVLFWIIRRALEDYGSLEGAFASTLPPDETEVEDALNNFCRILLGFGHEQFYPRGELKRRNGVRFFFPSPSEGSACKRLNLYLRWMVWPEDGIDCGVWTRVKPRQLVIPLDTHIARIREETLPEWREGKLLGAGLLEYPERRQGPEQTAECGCVGTCPRGQVRGGSAPTSHQLREAQDRERDHGL